MATNALEGKKGVKLQELKKLQSFELKLEMISDLKQKIVNPYQLALTVMGEQAKRYV